MPFDSNCLFGRMFSRVMWHDNKITTIRKFVHQRGADSVELKGGHESHCS